jgi:hypothetical protein
MAAYVKQAEQIVLIFSKAEANALLDLALVGADRMGQNPVNGSTADARIRSVKALEVACTPSSRSGAAIQ